MNNPVVIELDGILSQACGSILTTCYGQGDSDSFVCYAVWVIIKHAAAAAVGCWVC